MPTPRWHAACFNSRMTRPKKNVTVIAALLALAALVCLGAGMNLLVKAGAETGPSTEAPPVALVSRLAIVGGFLIFLLGTIALLTARRLAFGANRLAGTAPPETTSRIDIQDWGRELADIRDHLRQDLTNTPTELAVAHCDLVVPASWRPLDEYVLRTDGQPTDPLADLKRTRNQLMEAAERVDSIVQNINEVTSSDYPTDTCRRQGWRQRLSALLRRS